MEADVVICNISSIEHSTPVSSSLLYINVGRQSGDRSMVPHGFCPSASLYISNIHFNCGRYWDKSMYSQIKFYSAVPEVLTYFWSFTLLLHNWPPKGSDIACKRCHSLCQQAAWTDPLYSHRTCQQWQWQLPAFCYHCRIHSVSTPGTCNSLWSP